MFFIKTFDSKIIYNLHHDPFSRPLACFNGCCYLLLLLLLLLIALKLLLIVIIIIINVFKKIWIIENMPQIKNILIINMKYLYFLV